MKEDYYATLGVNKGAGKDEIKTAYRRMTQKYHPDRNPGNAAAEEKFKQVREAYDTLSDPQKREMYDRFGHQAFEHAGGGGHRGFGGGYGYGGGQPDFSSVFENIFGNFFGGGEDKPARRVFDLHVSFEEAALGCKKTIKMTVPASCDLCGGSGAKSGTKPQVCTTCGGNGQVRVSRGVFTIQQACGACRGKGRVIKSPCAECNGGGVVEAPRKLEAAVPGGVDDGEMIRLRLERGEVLLRMRVASHPLFQRDGDNLHFAMPVSITTAALGGNINIPKLGGGKIKITIPPETQSGGMLRLRGEGINRLRGGGRGDMFCRIVVETPVNLSEEQKSLLREFDKSLQKTHTPKGESWLQKVKSIFTE